jgi:hypothetical protein
MSNNGIKIKRHRNAEKYEKPSSFVPVIFGAV